MLPSGSMRAISKRTALEPTSMAAIVVKDVPGIMGEGRKVTIRGIATPIVTDLQRPGGAEQSRKAGAVQDLRVKAAGERLRGTFD
jgi:hypothetical protein